MQYTNVSKHKSHYTHNNTQNLHSSENFEDFHTILGGIILNLSPSQPCLSMTVQFSAAIKLINAITTDANATITINLFCQTERLLSFSDSSLSCWVLRLNRAD